MLIHNIINIQCYKDLQMPKGSDVSSVLMSFHYRCSATRQSYDVILLLHCPQVVPKSSGVISVPMSIYYRYYNSPMMSIHYCTVPR